MTSSSDHVALLELLGWTWMRRNGNPTYNHNCVWLFPPHWKLGDRGPVGTFSPCERFGEEFAVCPPLLDDNLLRTAREQLLTTDELRDEFIGGLAKLQGDDYEDFYFIEEVWKILSASAADQAAVLVGMFHTEKV